MWPIKVCVITDRIVSHIDHGVRGPNVKIIMLKNYLFKSHFLAAFLAVIPVDQSILIARRLHQKPSASPNYSPEVYCPEPF